MRVFHPPTWSAHTLTTRMSFEVGCHSDWCFCFEPFVNWVKFFGHPGNTICVIVHKPQVAVYYCFWFGESEFARNALRFPSLPWEPFWWKGSAMDFKSSDSKIAFFYCQFQTCLANLLGECPNVQGSVRSMIGCNPNIVHVIGNWSPSTTGSKYSLINLEKADTNLMRPCASFFR